jgi:hypothetical protein
LCVVHAETMKSFLYLIYSEIGFMIGKSSDIYRRFAVIDTHSPIELQLFRVYKIEKNGYHEKKLHKLFETKRIRGGWFALDHSDIEELDRYMLENDGTRILDNIKKVNWSKRVDDPESSRNPYHDIHKDIEKLENVVERLKGTLDGRKTL